MAAEAFDPGTRIALLEREAREQKSRVDRNSARLNAIEVAAATEVQITKSAQEDIAEIKKIVDRLVWAIVGLAFTIAGFLAQTIITAPH